MGQFGINANMTVRRVFQRLVFGVVLCLLIASVSVGSAQAHILRENNGVEAELHIPPNDEPLAQQATKLEFSFDSTQGTFNLQHCNCQVVGIKGALKTETTSLQASPAKATITATATIYFQEAGDYNIVLTGTSTNASFTSFKMTYPARVAKPLAKPRSAGSGIAIIAVTGVVVLAIAAYTVVAGRLAKNTDKADNRKQ